jgi:hypothetical protein
MADPADDRSTRVMNQKETPMTATMTNGKTRKNLSEQLDRLDGILDGLADGLNEAVAAAVREATTSAIRQALVEVLSNPDVLALIGGAAGLHAPIPPAPEAPAATGPDRPGLGQRLGTWAGQQVQAARAACDQVMEAGRRAGSGLWEYLLAVWQHRWQLVAAAAVGVAAGLAADWAGPWLAGVLAAGAGFVWGPVQRAWPWLRRLLWDLVPTDQLA